MRLAELEHARVAVLGLGREGLAVCHTLQQRWPDRSIDVYCEQVPDALQEDERLQVHVGALDANKLRNHDVLIKSPGISLYHPAVQQAMKAGSRVTSGTSIWFSERGDERVVAITGTKGKSTTAALTAHLLKAAGFSVQLAGNIGVPLISLLDASADVWVLELSSFQIADLSAEVELAVLLSLFPEHLDWHGGEQQYFRDKTRLLKLARDCLVEHELAAELQLQKAQQYNCPAQGWRPDAAGIVCDEQFFCALETLPLAGHHNAVNACAALHIASYFGAEQEQLLQALPSFEPLPHRLQLVGAVAGKQFINDSIATTPRATVMALRAFADQPVCLIAGGFDRGLDWQPVLQQLQQQPVHSVIGLPETGSRLVTAIQREVDDGQLSDLPGGVHSASDLAQAVQLAAAQPVDDLVVLLAPGAASFTQFKNFEHRGRVFAQLVTGLAKQTH